MRILGGCIYASSVGERRDGSAKGLGFSFIAWDGREGGRARWLGARAETRKVVSRRGEGMGGEENYSGLGVIEREAADKAGCWATGAAIGV